MQVLHVCSEMFPLLKTGGLADVIGHYPQHKSQTALTLAYCCLHFPIFAVALPMRR